jgi:NSS family neurotransmitter:Na+ symporter
MQRESWGSRIGFILASIGYAVGIGNLWRFPSMVGQYGGGAFLLFYLFVVFLIGIPMLSIEISLGKATRQDPVGAYKALRPGTPWFLNGYVNVLTNLVITGYVAPVAGWIAAYFFKTLIGTFRGMSPAEIEAYYNGFVASPVEVLAWTLILIVGLVVVLLRGVRAGVERVNKILIPGLGLLLIILTVRSLTLEGAGAGIAFYLKPDFSKFTTEAAVVALGQAFFSMGIALGAALVFGSYMRKEDGIVPNAVIIGLSDMGIAIMAGFMIFPIVFAFGLDPEAGFGLTFITMPNIFNQMFLGGLFGPLFFLLFFLASFTSFLGGTESIVAHLSDTWKVPRKVGVFLVCGTVLVIAVLASVSTEIFRKVDYAANNIFLILGALIMTIFVGHVWPLKQFLSVAEVRAKPARLFWTIIVRYFAPAAIIVIWLTQLGVIRF